MTKLLKFFLALILLLAVTVFAASFYINKMSVSQFNAIINEQLGADIDVKLQSRPVVRLFSKPTITLPATVITVNQNSEPTTINVKWAEFNLDWRQLSDKRVTLDKISADTVEYGNFNGTARIADDYQSAHIEGTASNIPVSEYTSAEVTGWLELPFYTNQRKGEFVLNAADMAIQGADLDYLVCAGASRVTNKRSLTPITNNHKTTLTHLKANATLDGDRVDVSNFTARSGHNLLDGTATLNLNSDRAIIDFGVKVGNREYCPALSQQLTETRWPFSCKLSLATQETRCGLDQGFIKELINSRFQDEAKEKLDGVLNKLFKKN